MPRRRRLLDRPEPADHHAVPDPGGRRRREPRLRLGRPPADDDRPDEAARALGVAADDARAPMAEAGGRLFVDVTRALASPASRAGLLECMGRSDPLIGDALQTIVDRGDFLPTLPDEAPAGPPAGGAPDPIETDPAIVTELIARDRGVHRRRGARHRGRCPARRCSTSSWRTSRSCRRVLFDPQSHQVIMAGMEATWWLNDQLQEWLGEKNAADTLTQSVPHNVTSEMGLALLDVADVIRPHPDVVAFLRRRRATTASSTSCRARRRARGARRHPRLPRPYGMRCVGEIDITRPRWSERPTTLVPADPRQRRELRARRTPRGASSKGGRRREEGTGRCSSACAPCPTASRRPTRPSG